jgi:hypothetical protein
MRGDWDRTDGRLTFRKNLAMQDLSAASNEASTLVFGNPLGRQLPIIWVESS